MRIRTAEPNADGGAGAPADVGRGYSLAREGGHGRRRVVHAGDATGAECVRALGTAIGRDPGIRLLAGVFMLDFLTADGRCVGVLAWREGTGFFVVAARAVVLAAGGAGRLFRETSNARSATGDGIAAAWRAGATLRDLEFVQFHPTTLYLAGMERALVTEAVRGEGAHVVDNEGRRFLLEAHESGELAPRDVVSRAIVEHLARPGVTGVFLDMRHWPAGRAAARFPGMTGRCARYGLDPERDPIPVRPAAHYFIGGVASDLDGRSDLPGLFVCGEASCSGLHGANRLASNSLLEGVALGRRAGRAAAAESTDRFSGDIRHETGRASRGGHEASVDLEDLRKSLASLMWRCLGVVREEAYLSDTATTLAYWRHFCARLPLFTRGAYELQNQLHLASLVTAAARLRTESRGTHFRSDHPRTDDRFRGHFLWRRGHESRFDPCSEEAATRG